MPRKSYYGGAYARTRSPSPPRHTPESVLLRYTNLKKNREEIIERMRTMNINFYFWSQQKHIDKISYIMNREEFSADAAINYYIQKNR